MNGRSIRWWIGCSFALVAMAPLLVGLNVYQKPRLSGLPQQVAVPPYRLPFLEEPGPHTWLLGQLYGNTQGAFRRRFEWYQAGQGLHFGLDFSARCGTPVVAIGDGEVVGVDQLERGAGPHNLLIFHPEGYVSLYGHLLHTPEAYRGMPVQRGQIVGYTGDPDLTCTSRPHLHLEIRSPDYNIAYNPIDLIEADWNSLAMFSRGNFQKDLSQPRRWQTLSDQPTVDFWGPMLNEYDETWPPEWAQ